MSDQALRPLNVLTVFGARPEAIKMVPLIAELERHPGRLSNRNCPTGQHKDMVAPLVDLFGIRVDHDLNLMRPNQTLEHITVTVLQEVGKILRTEPFVLRLVQGDTTTSIAAALVAFCAGVNIGHVEPGLRTFDKADPYPKESNRKTIDAVAESFSAHTGLAKQHLLSEGIADSAIEVTGKTVIDVLLDVSRRPLSFHGTPLDALPLDERKRLPVNSHPRESFVGPFGSVCQGMGELALNCRDGIVKVPRYTATPACARWSSALWPARPTFYSRTLRRTPPWRSVSTLYGDGTASVRTVRRILQMAEQ